jgi:hypothetical protein
MKKKPTKKKMWHIRVTSKNQSWPMSFRSKGAMEKYVGVFVLRNGSEGWTFTKQSQNNREIYLGHEY